MSSKFHEDIASKKCITFVTAVDGSRFSDRALQCTKQLMRKCDFVNVLHVYSSKEDKEMSKAADKHSDRIREKYELDLISSYPKRFYKLIWIDRFDTLNCRADSVHEVIVKMAAGHLTECSGHFLVVGYEGWRRHDENTMDHPSMAGSTTDFTMRHIHMPCIIVKYELPEGPNHFMMAVDDSNCSRLGLDILYALIRPQDKLTVIHVYDDAMDNLGNTCFEDVQKYYLEDLESECPTTNFVFEGIMKEGNTSNADMIERYANDKVPDFFCMAPRARLTNSFTSLTEQIILKVRANIILCKM